MLIKTICANSAASLLVLAVLVTACYVGVSSLPASSLEDGLIKSNPQTRLVEDKPALFDFDYYQKSFNKKYDSRLERAVRKCYYLAKAIMAYLSGVAYKFWLSSSYLSINEFSDWSKDELDKMKNKALKRFNKERLKLTEGIHKKHHTSEARDSKIVEVDFDPEKVATELENKIDQTLKEVRLDVASVDTSNKRQKRDLGSLERTNHKASSQKRRPRPMSLDKLVQGSEQVGQLANVQAKVDHNPKGNNKHYDRLLFEGMTMGLKNQQKQTQFWELSPPIKRREPDDDQYESSVARFRDAGGDDSDSDSIDDQDEFLPDEMFLDLRKSGCMLPPKRQSKCGACYAFVGITMAEYYYCKASGKLVEFSEQYMIDCGNDYIEGLDGCDGGDESSAPLFIQNFGLELAKTYPYVAKEQQCPYEEHMDINKTGYIRMNVDDVVLVDAERWRDRLQYGPIDVGVRTHPEFNQYGGGVYDGSGCIQEADHEMAVVGHGREDNREFWLLRNSYGVKWGEGGYFKLAKEATEKCIDFNAGVVYGTKDGINFMLDPDFNEQYDASILKRMQKLEAKRRRLF